MSRLPTKTVSITRAANQTFMINRKPINLNNLLLDRADQVARMLAGIRGDADLWTAEMRAATRGGKCVKIRATEEPTD
jgi:hypothetical protein